MNDVKPLRWQREVVELVKGKRVVLVSAGRAFGASWLGAYLLLQESLAGKVSVGMTPRWENQILGERLLDILGKGDHVYVTGGKGRMITFPNAGSGEQERGDILLTSQSNPYFDLGRFERTPLLTVIDSISNQIDPKSVISLIKRHMRVVVFGQRLKTSYRSSYFDFWFSAAWDKDAKLPDDWATYQALWHPSDAPHLAPDFCEQLNRMYPDGMTDWGFTQESERE